MFLRKKIQYIAFSGILVLIVGFFFISSYHAQAAEHQFATPNRYIITFKKGSDTASRDAAIQAFQKRLGKKPLLKAGNQLNTHLAKINAMAIEVPDSSALELQTRALGIGGIATIEPDYIAEKFEVTNDPDLSKQWGLFTMKVASQNTISAWDTTTGLSAIRIAVLDTGVNTTHSDLAGVVVGARDFTGSTKGTADADGHGSHVTGAIAALGNNAIGGAGIAYGVSILNGKVLGDTGSGSYSWIASGIIWAADNNAKVINMSLGGSMDSLSLDNAIDYAINKGAVVVAAAGNSGTTSKLYPAGYTPVISVAATDQNDIKATWSNYGNWVDVAAPGVSIYSTVLNNSYANYSGTSMATSYVSGVIGLIWSAGICQTAVCTTNTLFTSADAVSGTGTQFQYGRVNALNAISISTTPTQTVTATQTPSPTSEPTLMPTEPIAPTQTVTPTVTMTPTPTSSQKTITVSSIVISNQQSWGINTVSTQVTVKDQLGNPVSGVTVNLKTLTPVGISFDASGTTSTSGITTTSIRWPSAGTYKSTITSLSKNGYIYTPTIVEKSFNVQ